MIRMRKIQSVLGHNEMTEKMANGFRMKAFSSRPPVPHPHPGETPVSITGCWERLAGASCSAMGSVLSDRGRMPLSWSHTLAQLVSSPIKWVQHVLNRSVKTMKWETKQPGLPQRPGHVPLSSTNWNGLMSWFGLASLGIWPGSGKAYVLTSLLLTVTRFFCSCFFF